MTFAWWDLPDDCPHCGRPFEATAGQTIIATVAMRLLPEGGIEVDPSTTANWCGACVEEWNARMANSED